MYYFHVFYEHCLVIVEHYYLCYINDKKAPKQAGGPFQAVVILRNNIYSYSVFSHMICRIHYTKNITWMSTTIIQQLLFTIHLKCL